MPTRIKSLANITEELAQITQYPTNRFVKSARNKLAYGLFPLNILVQGDSTGNDENEWVYLLSEWIATKYPTYSVLYRNWLDSLQYYNGSRVLQNGTSGLACFSLASGRFLSTPDAVPLRITGDLEIIVKFAATNYQNGARQVLVSKYLTPNNAYAMGIDATGHPYLWTSTDGTSNTLRIAAATAALTTANGAAVWLKMTFDADNGAAGHDVKFYTSPNGVTWTQLGNTVTTAAAIAIYAGTARVTVGSREGGECLTGSIYSVMVKNGINGTPVIDFDTSTVFPISTSFTDLFGNVWAVDAASWYGSPGITIYNACHPGGTIDYSTNATRFALQAKAEPHLAFIAYGHNDASSGYQSAFEGLCVQLLTLWPNVGIVCVTQNPQTTPRTAAQILTHAKVTRDICNASAKNNYALLDVYGAMLKSGIVATLVGADGVHPTVLGSAYWCAEASSFLKALTA